MKKLFFCNFALFILIVNMLFPILGQATSNDFDMFQDKKFVYDFAGLIQLDDVQKIETIGQKIEDASGIRIVVVISDESEITEQDNYGKTLFDELDLSSDDGGILLITDKQKLLHMSEGYVETVFSPKFTNLISSSSAEQTFNNTVYPYFKKQDYSTGILNWYILTSSLVIQENNINDETINNIMTQHKQQFSDSKHAQMKAISTLILSIIFISLLSWLLEFNKPKLDSGSTAHEYINSYLEITDAKYPGTSEENYSLPLILRPQNFKTPIVIISVIFGAIVSLVWFYFVKPGGEKNIFDDALLITFILLIIYLFSILYFVSVKIELREKSLILEKIFYKKEILFSEIHGEIFTGKVHKYEEGGSVPVPMLLIHTVNDSLIEFPINSFYKEDIGMVLIYVNQRIPNKENIKGKVSPSSKLDMWLDNSLVKSLLFFVVIVTSIIISYFLSDLIIKIL